MQGIKLIIWAPVLLVGLMGCVQTGDDVEDSKEPELVTLRETKARLAKENETLKKKNLGLISRADYLAKRDRRLTKKISEMKFELDKLQEQIKILKDLPQERDRYKAEASKYKMQLFKLEMELRKQKQGEAERKSTESK